MRSFLPMLILAGCPWIDADELADRLDGDGDGVEGIAVGGTDCDDADPRVFPGAAERCNGVDDDCNGTIDDIDGTAEIDGAARYYVDGDGDGYGDDASAVWSCTPLSDTVTTGGDCDDGDADRSPDTIWYADADGDGVAATDAPPVTQCTEPEGHVQVLGDCDDANGDTFPGAIERCDQTDSDCDDRLDDPEAIDPVLWFADTDGDGHGDPKTSQLACAPGPGWVLDDDDCDDGDRDSYPGAEDPCYDGVDQDCAADDDDDCDGDGFAGFPGGGDDCDDDDPSIYPGIITTRRVPADHPTLQQALDVSCPDDVIQIAEGLHDAGVVAQRPVVIRGAGRGRTFLTGNDLATVVRLDAGGTLEDMSIQFGDTKGDGGCVHAATDAPVTLRAIDLLPCVAEGRGGGLYVEGALLVMDTVDIQVTRAEHGGGAYLADLQPGSRLETVEIQLSTATGRGGGLALLDSDVEVVDLRIVDAEALDGGALHLDGVGGSWTDVRLERPIGADHSGAHLTDVGAAAPFAADRWSIDEPSGGFFSTGVFAEGVQDATFTRLTITGGTSPTPDPSALFASIEGTAVFEQLQLLRPWGGVSLLASQGSVRFAHSTVVDPQLPVVMSGGGAQLAVMSHITVTGSASDGIVLAGNGTVEWCNASGSAGSDFGDVSLLGVDGNVSVDPGFVSVGPSLPADRLDVRLRADSLLRDAGAAAVLDPDGSRADIGVFGGPGANANAYDDDDSDGMLDTWETLHGLDPTVDDRAGDPDVDGLDNLAEFAAGTWPTAPDTDLDGVDDGAEVLALTDPLDASSL